MKLQYGIYILLGLVALWSCQHPSERKTESTKNEHGTINITTIDSSGVLSAFDIMTKDSLFLDRIYHNLDRGYSIYSEERPIIIGDFNNDGLSDALMPFAIQYQDENRKLETGLYYAVFFHQDGKLVWVDNFNRVDSETGQTITFTTIKDQGIYGTSTLETLSATKENVIYTWTSFLLKTKINKNYMIWQDVKLNGKYSMNPEKEEVYELYGEPDSSWTYISDCNADNGIKYDVYQINKATFDFVNNRTKIDYIDFDKNPDLFLISADLKLDRNTNYQDILNYFPDLLLDQPLETNQDRDYSNSDIRIIYIQRSKFYMNFEDGYGWIQLQFKNNQLSFIQLVYEDPC